MVAPALRLWVRRQMFDPTLAGVLVNPFYLTRRALARAMRRIARRVSGRLLDVGCGQKPYKGMFDVTAYVGVEIDSPENRRNKPADQFYDGRRLPFADGEFDAVLCNQVLEHVFEPDEFVSELNRVLKPEGLLVLTAPFVWDEHEQPFDYARYSSFGLQHLLTKHGFKIDELVKTLPDVSMLFQLGNAYLYKVTTTRFRTVNVILTAVLMAPISVLGLVMGSLLPSDADLYMDNVVVARKQLAAA